MACRAMRAAGLASVNPSSPELAALIDAGATADVLADAAARAVGLGKGFAYALGMVRGQMADAARVAAAVAGAGLVPPARASPQAMPKPIPPLPPVTTATLPARLGTSLREKGMRHLLRDRCSLIK